MASCRIQEREEKGKTFHKLHVLGMSGDLSQLVMFEKGCSGLKQSHDKGRQRTATRKGKIDRVY